MATPTVAARPAARPQAGAWIGIQRLSAPAWISVGVVAVFIAITSWWIAHDRSIPIFDAGLHLSLTIRVHELLVAGRLGDALTQSIPYPPLVYLIGSAGIAVGGVGIAPPVIAQNLVFVPLLALGCYQVARMAFGSWAGLLAVVFALGSPLLIAQFHVFMTDAPETAMVAVSIWLILASEYFSRFWISALAGLMVGLGMLTKEPFGFAVAGVVLVSILRGGWRSWRGLAVFLVVAAVVALPWYIAEYGQIQTLENDVTVSANLPQLPGDIAPARFTRDNFEWYFWNFAQVQLYIPMLIFAVVGWVWMIVGFVRRRTVSRFAPELAVGAFVGWLAITQTFVHDARYSEPLLFYLAVIGTGWIVRLPRRGRAVAASVLAIVALANTLGTSFGVGGVAALTKPRWWGTSVQQLHPDPIYSNVGFLVSGPKRDGDMLAMLRALRRQGVEAVEWPAETQVLQPDFSSIGVLVLAQIATLTPLEQVELSTLNRHVAALEHESISAGSAPPCVRLDDGTGVWVRLGNPLARGAQDYCPLPKPHFYGPRQK
jgi:hypothetical protein